MKARLRTPTSSRTMPFASTSYPVDHALREAWEARYPAMDRSATSARSDGRVAAIAGVGGDVAVVFECAMEAAPRPLGVAERMVFGRTLCTYEPLEGSDRCRDSASITGTDSDAVAPDVPAACGLAERHVEQKLDELAGHISELREDHEEAKVDIRREVDNLEEVVRTTFEELGVDLPPRPISLRGRVVAGTPRVSAAAPTVRGGGRMTRMRQWLRRMSRRLWEVVHGKPEES